jgi:hypothetical protein
MDDALVGAGLHKFPQNHMLCLHRETKCRVNALRAGSYQT